MSEFRRDPVVGRWVAVATDDARQPEDFVRQLPATAAHEGFCPFCTGNEHYTPPEVLAYRREGTRPNAMGWRLRVVPNKYPAITDTGRPQRDGIGLYDRMAGIGRDEVVIEHPDHHFRLSQQPEKTYLVVKAWHDRMLALRQDERWHYGLIYKNHGQQAGATLAHSHSQVLALPHVPKHIHDELAGCERYYDWKERSLLLDLVREEIEHGERIVQENQRFVALMPYAARFPFETWILPKTPQSHFEWCDDMQLRDFARLLCYTLQQLDRRLVDPAYCLTVHSAPWRYGPLPYYLWHAELTPRFGPMPGADLSTDFFHNPLPPEAAARFLRGEPAAAAPPVLPAEAEARFGENPVHQQRQA